MKRNFAICLALLLAFWLSGCGEDGQQQTDPPSKPSPAQTQIGAAADSAIPEIAPPEEFVRISGGTFQMGSAEDEPWRVEDETAHTVTLNDFYISQYEVTQQEYKAVMGTNPSSFAGDDLPVEGVSWLDAVQYCNARSAIKGLTPA